MPKSPGQSAMEYMLTYGWAILVVMVVGIVMWQIGIFNIGGSTPTTSDGFAQLKPMLATCKMSEDVWGGSDGFQCMFTNPLQMSIYITDINVTVNEKYCRMIIADAANTGGSSAYLYKGCSSETYCANTLNCQDLGPGDCGCGNTCLIIPGGSTFFVNMFEFVATWGPCGDIKPGSRYEASIDITYNISIGGKTVTKHSTGHIRGMME